MSSAAIGMARRRALATPRDLTAAQDRSIRRRVGLAWGLLFLNTLTFLPGGILPISAQVGKALAQAALPLAILVALTLNPRLKVRPSVFLCLITLLVLEAAITTLQPAHLG